MNTKKFTLAQVVLTASITGMNAQTVALKASAHEKLISHISHEYLKDGNVVGHDEISFNYENGMISHMTIEWTEASETLGVEVKCTPKENGNIIDFKQKYYFLGYERDIEWGSYYISDGKIVKSEETLVDSEWKERTLDFTYDGDRLSKVYEVFKAEDYDAFQEISFRWDANGNIPEITHKTNPGVLKVENTISDVRNRNGILNILFGGTPTSIIGEGGETIIEFGRLYLPMSILCGTAPANLSSDCIVKNDNNIVMKRHYSYDTDAEGYVTTVKMETNGVLKDIFYITWGTETGIKETEMQKVEDVSEYSLSGIQYRNADSNIYIKNGKKYLKRQR